MLNKINEFPKNARAIRRVREPTTLPMRALNPAPARYQSKTGAYYGEDANKQPKWANETLALRQKNTKPHKREQYIAHIFLPIA